MSRPVIITCAVTGSADVTHKNPAVPVTPKQIAESAIEAASAGAAVVHIHVRDPQTGKPSMRFELYEETVNRIRDSGCKALINLTSGAGARFTPSESNPRLADERSTIVGWKERIEHIRRLGPDICSLDVGSFNFGESVFVNTPTHLRLMAKEIMASRVKPELEVFELGHIRFARQLIDQGLVAAPPMFQICLGIPFAAPANIETLLLMKSNLPMGSNWAAFGIGMMQMPMVAYSALLGGHTRVGLEDNLYLSRGVLAHNNACLVEKAVGILSSLDFMIADPETAARLLGLSACRNRIAS